MAKATARQPVSDPDWLRDAAIGIEEAKTATDLDTVAAFIKDGVTAGKCSPESRDNLLAKWKTRKTKSMDDQLPDYRDACPHR